jgi:hypothetical protein
MNRNRQKIRQSDNRSKRGSSIAELPVVLWLIFFVFLFPLVDVAFCGLRLTFLYAAAHNACISAARARTYQTTPDTHPTAIQLAQTGASLVINGFSGVHQDQLQTAIIVNNVNTNALTVVPGPLSTPPDTSNNTYQIQVTLNGHVDPFIPIFLPTGVPGLNQPLYLTFTEAQFFENPAGLTL